MNALSVLLSHPDGISVFDNKMRTVFINPAFSEILKLSGTSCEGKPAEDIFAYAPEIIELLTSFFRDGVGYHNHDFVIEAPRNKKIPVELTISPIDYGQNETGACVILRSNIGKRELHSEIEKEGKIAIMSMMAAGLAHEIKNPLSGIKGAAQLIIREKKDPTNFCQMIVKEADRINSLVNELLTLGSETSPKRVKVNIHEILNETLAMQEPLLPGKGITAIRDYDPSLPEIKADPDKLKQVFLNLTKNAIEIMDKGGELRIKTRMVLDPTPTHVSKGSRRMLSIEVIDSGKGIDPKVARHLFTPFNTNRRQGTGLGLFLSLKIIKDHGGTLTLENRRDGKGANARAILPLS